MSERYPLPPDGIATTKNIKVALRAWMKHAEGLADLAHERLMQALDADGKRNGMRLQAERLAQALRLALGNPDQLYAKGTEGPHEALKAYEWATHDSLWEGP